MGADGAAKHPAHWAADVLLRDGSTVHIRPIAPHDAPALQRFHLRQSAESVYYRFFAPHERLSDSEAAHFTCVDHVDRVALVLVNGEEIVGVGRYDRLPDHDSVAEVAFTVADTLRGRGLGSVLLEHLASAAAERGVRRFVADVLPGNVRMINVFRDAGYDVRQAYDDGVVAVGFDIEATERSLAVMAEREQHADAESMRALLGATSVVVLADGAGIDEAPLARRVAQAVLASDFRGQVHLVGSALDGLGPVALARTLDVPASVDLALVAAPAARLPALVAEAAQLGARGVVVLSGASDGRDALRAAREHGVRLVGPESFGLVADSPGGRLNATLRTVLPPNGGFGLFCQSAAAGLGLLTAVERRGIALGTFLSAGHRADVSGNDVMQFWLDHEATDVVGVYLESIGNPRKFSRVARRLSGRKPVIAVVSGQTGQAVPPGHAVRTSSAPRCVLTQMLRQAGVIRAGTTSELLDVAGLLQSQPLPRGDRVGVLTNSGSLASLAVEVARAAGLVPVEPEYLPTGADGAAYAAALERWAARTDWDALVVAYVPMLGERDPGVGAALAETAARSSRPLLACVLGLQGLTAELRAPGGEIVPAFESLEDAVAALARAVGHVRWTAAQHGRPAQRSGIDHHAARGRVAAVLAATPAGAEHELDAAESADLLACYGVAVWRSIRVSGVDEALEAAKEIGWPVAVKTCEPSLRHRLDLGGVRLDVTSEPELRHAIARLDGFAAARPGTGERFEVQAMAPRGVACVVRAIEDELYGPVVSFGLAGDAADLLEDVAYRIPPLTDADVADMVRSVRAAPRLLGRHGLPVSDLAALEDVVSRLAMFKDDLPEVASVALNPVVVGTRGAAVLEARVVLAHPARWDRARRVLPG